jgi:hypothetical protein
LGVGKVSGGAGRLRHVVKTEKNLMDSTKKLMSTIKPFAYVQYIVQLAISSDILYITLIKPA